MSPLGVVQHFDVLEDASLGIGPGLVVLLMTSSFNPARVSSTFAWASSRSRMISKETSSFKPGDEAK
jgi:hypothetical protein